MVSLCFFVVTMVSRADDLALWKIQKLQASKKYVDLAHDFAPGIQRRSSGLRNGKKITAKSPGGAFVAMRTDWSKRLPDATKMENKDGKEAAHYPGWSLPALKFLYEERRITASGHETTDTDPGIAASKDDYSLETYILSTNHYQIELLTNLDQVPEAGAIVVATFPKPRNGSGFPARVFAIVPRVDLRVRQG